MRPLELSEKTRAVERLLANADGSIVRKAIAELGDDSGEDDAQRAALGIAAHAFANGALLLREGALFPAGETLREASALFLAAGESEAAELSLIEATVADVRRGVRDLAIAGRALMVGLSENGSSERVRVSALIVRGTADRVLGDAASAHRTFLEVKDRAAFPELKTQALNSLGTLYVVTGALGAAKSVLEAAAELCHARGDSVGEAIAMGQLGAVAMGLGDLSEARRHLSRQEWLARQVGDAFGRSRALVWLAEVALELGAPDDAIDIATRAQAVADAAGLGTFKAYADRVIGRAKRQLGEDGKPFTERALVVFQSQHLPLGEALSTWDLALGSDPIDRAKAQTALSSLASLGLSDRVVEVLLDLHEIEANQRNALAPVEHRSPDVKLLLMAASLSGRKAETLETQLVHEDPEALAMSVVEKSSAKRNLARLSSLAVDTPGLVLVATMGGLDPVTAVGDRSFGGALAGQLGSVAVFVWHASVDTASLARDIVLVVSDSGQAVVDLALDGEVTAPGFGGGFSAQLDRVDTAKLVQPMFATPSASRSIAFASSVDRSEAWSKTLETALMAAGLAPSSPSS